MISTVFSTLHCSTRRKDELNQTVSPAQRMIGKSLYALWWFVMPVVGDCTPVCVRLWLEIPLGGAKSNLR